jgi:hypothetical protein
MSRDPAAPGPTGHYPRARLNAEDEGGLNIAISHGRELVHLRFGTPVAWFALPPQQAADLASALLKHAREAAREAGVTITLRLGGEL